MAKSGLVNLDDFAATMKVSLRAVQKARKEGRISATKIGRQFMVDPVAAKQEWLSNTSLLQSRKKNQNVGAGTEYAKAETDEKKYRAQLLKLKVQQQMGVLVNVQEIDAQAFQDGRKIRDAFLAQPSRLSAQLAGETDPHQIEMILLRDHNQLLEKLSCELGQKPKGNVDESKSA